MSESQKNGYSQRPGRAVAEAAGNVLEEIASLAGLQIQLCLADFREARARLFRSTAVLLVAVAVILGAVPVLLAGVGMLLHELAGWPMWAALLTSGVVTVVLAGLAGWGSVVGLQNSMNAFERSQEQLRVNVEQVRNSLRRDRSPNATAKAAFRQEAPPAGSAR